MKTLTRTVLTGLVGLSLSFAACDSDSNTNTTDTVTGDTTPGDTVTPTDTPTGDTTAVTNACMNATDPTVIQTADPAPDVVAAACGTSSTCVGLAFTDIPAFGVCVQACMVDGTTGAGVTAPCAQCYTEAVVCTAEHCLVAPANCASAPTGEACVACRATNGCTSGFFTCSGLPVPSPNACMNATDPTVIQTADPAPDAVASACGTSSTCVGLAFTDIPAFGVCVQACMVDDTTGAGVTAPCAQCYTEAVVCTAEHCLVAPANCASAPSGADCVACRADNGCTSGFYTCSGLPQN